ncbi:MAG: hypothetical protein ACR2PL_24755, partial [Dehalococcoidia bacterium]
SGNCFVPSALGFFNSCAGLFHGAFGGGCLVTTALGVSNLCDGFNSGLALGLLGTTSPSCVQSNGVTVVNVCPGFFGGFGGLGGCNAIGPSGLIVNTCGFQPFQTGFTNPNCLQIVNTALGPVTQRVC